MKFVRYILNLADAEVNLTKGDIMKSKMLNEKGFSLVELAISITIIGVLLAGVIKGQEIVVGARMTSTVAKISTFDAARNNFYNFYDELPGDMENPDLKIPVCAADAGACYSNGDALDGDGDGIIEATTATAGTDAAVEGRAYWEHLAAAEMLFETDVNPGANNVWGASHPKTPFGGGVILTRDPVLGAGDDAAALNGMHYRLSRSFTAGGGANTSLVKPSVAIALDRKLDDGDVFTGIVRVYGASCITEGTLAIADDRDHCDLLVAFQ